MQPEISLSSPIELPMSPALAGARIQGVWQDGDRALVLETHSGAAGVAWWLFSLDAAHTRLERLAARPSRPAGKKSGGQPAFCQWLRSKLLGARVASLRLPHPQMVKLELTKGPAGEQDRYFLLLELNRRVSNLLLLDSAENLLIALRHPAHAGRKMGPGKPYAPPAKIYPYPEGVPLEMRYPAPDTEEEQARREIWRNLESGEPSRASPEGGKGNADVDREQREAQKAARRELKKIRRRKANLEQDLEGVSQAGEWLRLGELLQINSHLIRPGMSSLTVPDVFQPGQPETVIELDPGATPGENMERHFRRARKLTASEPHVRERLVRAEEEERAWEGLLGLLGGEEGPADAGVPGWDAIRQEARTRYPAEARRLGLFGGVARGVAGGVTGGVAAGRSVAARTGTSGGMAEEPPGVIIRTSSDGHTLLAGRTAEANDRVTFRMGRGNDWWFHAQGIQGSHVIARPPPGGKGGTLPPATLREAAWLAAYYSQGRGRGKVEVDYTLRKNVRRIKGATAGNVTYTGNKTVLVDIDDEKARKVLDRKDGVGSP